MRAFAWAQSANRNLLLCAVALIIAGMAGCGGGSGNGFRPGPGTNNSLLKGQYAFSFSGESSSQGFVTAAGSFNADGNGKITAGMIDMTFSAANNGINSTTFTGSYSVGTDNRGNAVLTGIPGCGTWQFTLTGANHGLMSCFGLGVDPVVTASGAFDLQNAAAFTMASLTGKYVFSFAGAGNVGSAAVMAGQWSMDGLGHITAGELDVNDSLSVLHATNVTGSYSVGASNGRGTAQVVSTYGTQNFAFYIVSANDLKFVETDLQPTLSGEVLTQAAAPFNLKGSYAFTMGGVDVSGAPRAIGGIFSADGAGILNPGNVGVIDSNDSGLITQGAGLTSTAYSFSASGRGTASLVSSAGNFNVAVYTAANGTVNLVEVDGNNVQSGSALLQSGTPLTASALSGNYALNFTGTNLSAGNEEDITGLLTSNGSGALSGTLDINNFGSITQGVSISASSFTPTAVVGLSGYGNAPINTSSGNFNMQVYQVNSRTALLLDVDGGNALVPRVLTGILQQ